MASYIELDKQLSLPSASGEGRVILGVNPDGTVTTTDHNGYTIPVGGMVEGTYTEISASLAVGGLNPSTLYKITNATTSSEDQCLQEGGVNIILQALTSGSLSSVGTGLFWVPNYEDPNNPTAPPDTNYCVWTNTARLNIANLSGIFEYNEYVYFYSNDTGNSTYAYVQGMPSSDWVTIIYENSASAAFFADNSNFVGLTMEGDYSGVTADIIGSNYITTYAVGDKVIWGGRVWENLSGSIGYGYGMGPGDINYQLNLNPEDWTVVPFNTTDYTLVANEIKYELEYDNISYRADSTNKVSNDFNSWINAWGFNSLKFFPWGNYGVRNNTFDNVYITDFINYPHDATAIDLNFKRWSSLNASAWGKQMELGRITADEGSSIYDHTFAFESSIRDINIGKNAEMYNIITAENTDIQYVEIGMNASFGHLRMYQGSSIERVNIGISSRLTNMYLYDWANIYDVTLDVQASLRCMYLDPYAEIKYVSIGNNSRIEYFNLHYSSCLKRTSLANDCYFTWSDLGENSFFRQLSLSDRAYLYNISVGDYSYFQNINIGAYSYIDNVNTNTSTYFENITLAPNTDIYQIFLDDNTVFRNISFLPDSSCGYVDIYANSSMNDIQVGVDAGFGEISLQSGYTINNIEIGQNCGFGGLTVDYNLANKTISRGFSNLFTDAGVVGSIGSYNSGNYQNATQLNTNDTIQYLDTTGWDGSGDTLNYYLPSGWYEGQKIELVLGNGGINMGGNAGKINIWVDALRDPAQGGNGSTNVPWYAFSKPDNGSTLRYDNPKAVWVASAWTIDNNAWD